MAFDPANHNLTPTEEELARALNDVYEALADGIDLKDDSGVLFQSLLKISGLLGGKPLSEIKTSVAKAGVANVFDELAEREAEQTADEDPEPA